MCASQQNSLGVMSTFFSAFSSLLTSLFLAGAIQEKAADGDDCFGLSALPSSSAFTWGSAVSIATRRANEWVMTAESPWAVFDRSSRRRWNTSLWRRSSEFFLCFNCIFKWHKREIFWRGPLNLFIYPHHGKSLESRGGRRKQEFIVRRQKDDMDGANHPYTRYVHNKMIRFKEIDSSQTTHYIMICKFRSKGRKLEF